VKVIYAPVAYDAGLHARMRTQPHADLLAENAHFPSAFMDALPQADVLMTLLAPVAMALNC